MYIFTNLDDALLKLENHSQNFRFPVRKNLQTSSEIIKLSVGQNIFRALALESHKPSFVYRNWASANFQSLYRQLEKCNNQGDFDSIVKSFTNNFLNAWTSITKERLVYGPASKIVNLLIKAIQESNQYKLENIVSFQHVPWDSYTLRPLKNIINELTDKNYYINIPATAAMSFVITPELYSILQKAIFKLYSRLPKQPPPIFFDYFAWNDNH